MPEPTVPTPRPLDPSITVHVGDLALAWATATRDDRTGVVSVAIGSSMQRVVLADDPAVLMVLLSDGLAQLEAIAGDL
jgi:hypothetical protein